MVCGTQVGSGGVRGGAEDDDDAAGPGGVDVADPRFSKLFSSHQFALDPTHPRCVASSIRTDVMLDVDSFPPACALVHA